MPNWTAITIDSLKAAGHGAIIENPCTGRRLPRPILREAAGVGGTLGAIAAEALDACGDIGAVAAEAALDQHGGNVGRQARLAPYPQAHVRDGDAAAPRTRLARPS